MGRKTSNKIKLLLGGDNIINKYYIRVGSEPTLLESLAAALIRISATGRPQIIPVITDTVEALKLKKEDCYIEFSSSGVNYKNIFTIKTIISEVYSTMLDLGFDINYNILNIIQKAEDEKLEGLETRFKNFCKCKRMRTRDFDIFFNQLIDFGECILLEQLELCALTDCFKEKISKEIEKNLDENYVFFDCYVSLELITEELKRFSNSLIRFIILKVDNGYSRVLKKTMYEIVEIDSQMNVQLRISQDENFEYKITNNNTLVTYSLESALKIINSFKEEQDIYNIL